MFPHGADAGRTEWRAVELRAEGGRAIGGTVVRYGDTANLGQFRETIARGGLSIAGDARLNLQHQRHILLARAGAGLTFVDGPEALEMRAELPATRAADDVLEGVRAGLLRGLSAEMVVKQDRWEGRERTIERAELRSVAVVDTPAYPLSGVEMRALGGIRPEDVWAARCLEGKAPFEDPGRAARPPQLLRPLL